MKSNVEEKYPWADLVIALLSVNNYPPEKTFSLFEGFAEVELFDPAKLAVWDLSEISQRMGRAGYDRGPTMTQIFAERLLALGKYLERCGMAYCEGVLASGTRLEIAELLSPAKGIGPRVLENFFLLRGTPR